LVDRWRIKDENRSGVPSVPGVDYVELRCRSAFSFLEASSNPEDLIAAAADSGHAVLALADRGGLYGIPRFHLAARSTGVRAIVGATLQVSRSEPKASEDQQQVGRDELLLLVETPRGYRNLARLVTCGHARGGKEAAVVSWTRWSSTPPI
jgi:error-prone DNA polymerase